MTNTLLTFEHIALRYPTLACPVLDDINYTIHQGDFVVILGANGSGKSSLLKLIDGRYQASQGKITLRDQKINSLSFAARAKHIGTLTQSSKDNLFLNLTVLENYQLRQQQAMNKYHKTDISTHLNQFNPNLINKLSVLVNQLSGGEQQALALALAMIKPPDLLLLDEHTSALDPKTASQLMALTAQIIQQQQLTAILTTHDVNHALTYGNRILALKEGQIHAQFDKQHQPDLDANQLLAECY